MGLLTWLTIVLLGAFAGVDAAAHLTHYRYGQTFSACVWWLEKRVPVLRAVVVLLCALLASHLALQLP